MAVVDRYLLRGIAVRFAAVVGIALAILSLENVTRLATDLQHTDAPVKLLARLSLLLLPEHLAIALTVAVLLATALTVRDLALKGEWQMLAASGMSPWRMARAPLLFALVAAGIQLVDRLEWRPAAERGLDALYMEVHSGLHGTALVIGKPIKLDETTTLFVSFAPARADGPLTGVLLRRGADVAAAPRAVIGQAGAAGVTLDLQDGVTIHRLPTGGLRRLGFRHMAVHVDVPTIGLVAGNARHKLDRLGAGDLLQRAAGAMTGSDRATAAASLVSRIEDALFVLLVPFLGIVLGQPPRRSQSGIALLLGLVLVVVHLQSAAFVEDNLASAALLAGSVHLAIWAALTVALVRYATRHGEGAVETALLRVTKLRLPSRRPIPQPTFDLLPEFALAPARPEVSRPAPAWSSPIGAQPLPA